ncbi:MAG: nitroimidazol reductase NimA-like FMN-containing flavoprotein [Candidatus Endobugula sp.]|jgi:nitroimidazol reductase NimA-like FMN-containing flavoprotein (pyridoxamine 5'-phosphate oxidase superfamily)
MNKPNSNAPTQRSIIKQGAAKADYSQETIYSIVDDAVMGVVAIATENGPLALPMAIARIGDHVYLHGSRSSRLMKHLAAGNEVCICITHLDGIVVARSGMHCSANYRSVVVHGKGIEITAPEEHAEMLYQITHKIIPGSDGDYRKHLSKELKATALVAIPLAESACKIRVGGPNDDKEDLDLPYWAGVIPVTQVYGEPVPSGDLRSGIATPAYALHHKRG